MRQKDAQLVLHQLNTLTACMRRNAKWRDALLQHSSTMHDPPEPTAPVTSTIPYALTRLRNALDNFNSLENLDVMAPFLQVVQSPDSTGPITGQALASIERILSAGAIGVFG